MKFREPTTATYCNLLLYGPAGTGKTAAAATMPGEGIWYWNLDLPNALSYARSRDTEGRILEVDDSAGIMATMIDVANAVYEPQNIATTFALDTVGELHRRLLEESSNRAIRPTLPTYGDVSVHVERFIRHLCEAPINLVVVAHEHGVKDEATGEVERLPWTGTTNPALANKIAAMVDVVAYTGLAKQDDGSVKYMAQLVSDRGRRGKDRFDVLGEFRELDLGEWLSVIHGSQNTNEPAAPEMEKAA